MEKSGTSAAAPVVAGVVALMLAEARSRGLSLSAEQIRQILIETARPDPPSSPWDPQYGHGRVDALAAVERVVALMPALPHSQPT